MSTAPERAETAPVTSGAHVGRQAIFDADLEVFGYELLFRTADGQGPGSIDGDEATSEVLLTTFLDIGIERITGDRLAFINMTRHLLLDPGGLPLPPGQVVLEVLEDVEVDADLVTSLVKLARRGFRIALDDFDFRPSWMPVVPFVDFVKIDVRGVEPAELERALVPLRRARARLLAEKVETREEYDLLRDLGFELFQGFFLSKPQLVSGRRIADDRLSMLRLLSRLQDPAVGVDEIEELVVRDLPLTYKLLRYLNSPIFAVGKQVTTVRHAVVLLGLEKLRRWTSLVLIARSGAQPSELLTLALVRARMCENLARATGARDTDAHFTAGMLSALDLLVGAPMSDLLPELPLNDDLRDALAERSGPIGAALDCTLAYEDCEFEAARCGGLAADAIRDAYAEATAWAFEAHKGLAED